jgi:hypothetical protein
MQRKQISSNNPMEFCEQLVEAAKEGWEIDDDEHFSMFFNLFCIGMKKWPDEAIGNIGKNDCVFVTIPEVTKKSVGRSKAVQ